MVNYGPFHPPGSYWRAAELISQVIHYPAEVHYRLSRPLTHAHLRKLISSLWRQSVVGRAISVATLSHRRRHCGPHTVNVRIAKCNRKRVVSSALLQGKRSALCPRQSSAADCSANNTSNYYRLPLPARPPTD
jgi:hypothetical protein